MQRSQIDKKLEILTEFKSKLKGVTILKINQRTHIMKLKQYIHALVWLKRHWSREYSVKKIEYFKRFIKKDDVCLDIGAHAGSWTRPLSNMVTNGTVYAFEALPYYSDILKVTLRVLGCKNVVILNYAVSDTPGNVEIIWKDNNKNKLTGMTHIAGMNEAQSDSVTVESIALDDFIFSIPRIRRLSFIKMDIEGAEYLSLKGSIKIIEEFRPVIFLELCNPYCERYGYQDEDIFNFFLNLNYNSFQFEKEDSFSALKEIDVDNYRACEDVLFIPHEKISNIYQ